MAARNSLDVVLDRYKFAEVEDLLEALGAKARPPAIFRLWGLIIDDAIDSERRLFASGRGWTPDKDATKERKARDKDPKVRANSSKPNVASGALRDFMTSEGPGAQPLKMDADELRIGIPGGQSDVFYGRFQAKHGRDPRISRSVVRRIASKRILEHLAGD